MLSAPTPTLNLKSLSVSMNMHSYSARPVWGDSICVYHWVRAEWNMEILAPKIGTTQQWYLTNTISFHCKERTTWIFIIIFFLASRGASERDAPPPYAPPMGPWHAAPPPAYAPSPAGYYGWVPPTHAFPDAPPGKYGSWDAGEYAGIVFLSEFGRLLLETLEIWILIVEKAIP
jgi:hypothetical protein